MKRFKLCLKIKTNIAQRYTLGAFNLHCVMRNYFSKVYACTHGAYVYHQARIMQHHEDMNILL